MSPRPRVVVPPDPEAQARRTAQGLRFLGRALFFTGAAADRRARGVCIVCGDVPAGPPAHTCKGCAADVGHGLVDSAIAVFFGGKK